MSLTNQIRLLRFFNTLPPVITVDNVSNINNVWSGWKIWSECGGGCEKGSYARRRLCMINNCSHSNNPTCVSAPSFGVCISVNYMKKTKIEEETDVPTKCHVKSNKWNQKQGSGHEMITLDDCFLHVCQAL